MKKRRNVKEQRKLKRNYVIFQRGALCYIVKWPLAHHSGTFELSGQAFILTPGTGHCGIAPDSVTAAVASAVASIDLHTPIFVFLLNIQNLLSF